MENNGWTIQTLDDVSKITRLAGAEYSDVWEIDPNGEIIALRGYNIGSNEINLRDVERISQNMSLKLSRSKLSKGDIVFPCVGSIGKAYLVKEDNRFHINQNIAKITPKEIIDPLYLTYCLLSIDCAKQILTFNTSSSQPNVLVGNLRKFKFSFPRKLPEQRKIANILSTWDKAISTTERLIDNSRQQKKALMQQLLTGKKRLLDDSGKPFEGEWVDRYLHDVAQIIVSPVDKKTIEGEIPVELCNYTDVYYNTRITKSLNFMKATAKKAEIDKYTLQVNDVIVTKDSETPGDIAVPALVSEDLNGVVCGYHLAIIRPKNELVEGAFLNYLFSMPKTRYYFFTLATGATRFGLSVGGINKAHFTLPPLVEQQKIATVLANADQEIEQLARQLSDLKQEKKALMQQLLTGTRRVKFNDKEVA